MRIHGNLKHIELWLSLERCPFVEIEDDRIKKLSYSRLFSEWKGVIIWWVKPVGIANKLFDVYLPCALL